MGSRGFVVLLPPSEGKAADGSATAPWDPHRGAFGASLGARRLEVIGALKTQKGGSDKLLGVSGAHLARAQRANRALLGGRSLPAWQRYTGVVWDHLDLASIPAARRKTMLTRIVVPSALSGLVRADDEIPDYRLKMGARLSPLGVMSKWWREDLTEALVGCVGSKAVVDLLPNEHRAAIDWTRVKNPLRIELVAKKGGAVGGHNAKAAKGLLARHLLCSGGTDIASAVGTFRHDLYRARITS